MTAWNGIQSARTSVCRGLGRAARQSLDYAPRAKMGEAHDGLQSPHFMAEDDGTVTRVPTTKYHRWFFVEERCRRTAPGGS